MPDLTVRPLDDAEVERVDRDLPLHRLNKHQDGNGTYLVAWDGPLAVGHAIVAWPGSRLRVPELPEIQDMYVHPERRREGIGLALTAAAEQLAAERGFHRVVLGVSVDNAGARALYERAGYRDTGLPPERVHGTITIRDRPVEVDDTLVYLVKAIGAACGADPQDGRAPPSPSVC